MCKPVAACLAVVLCGSVATSAVPFAFDFWDPRVRIIELALLVVTVAATLEAGRRTFGRPYLRRQVVVTAVAAPFALTLVLVAVVFGLDLAGAHCPRSGMDYISECNDLAGASMMVFFLGLYPVAVLVLIALAVLPAAGVKRTLAARRRGGSAPAADGSR